MAGRAGGWEFGWAMSGNWEQFEDEEGNAYYYNHATDETSWDRPSDFAGSGGGAAGSAGFSAAWDNATGSVAQWLPLLHRRTAAFGLDKKTTAWMSLSR